MIVLIPAYEPDARLVGLVEALGEAVPELAVVVVDDGSGPAHTPVLDAVRALGATVLTLPDNRGKGYALRVGFRHAQHVRPGEDVVTADCDGQHSVVDVVRVADRLRSGGGAVILGARRFTGHVPMRSRLGNAVSRALVHLATRQRLQDTQTGLRGYPAALLGWLQGVPGDRFEYELGVLLHAARAGHAVDEVEIATIYLDGNASSHFRPVADSVRVYGPLLAFALSSLGAFAVDTLALLVLDALTGSLVAAALGARAVSSAVNFLTNRRLVFAHGREKPVGVAAAQYYALVVVLLAANVGLLAGLTGLGLALLPAKVLTEATLFLVSFQVQRRLVFAQPPSSVAPAAASSTPAAVEDCQPTPR